MTSLDDLVPSQSKYLKSSDVQAAPGGEVTLYIESFAQENMNDGARKAVMYFKGVQKGFVLNVTNKERIKHLYPNADLQGLIGKPITLTVEFVQNPSGQQVPAIRIKMVRSHNSQGGGAFNQSSNQSSQNFGQQSQGSQNFGQQQSQESQSFGQKQAFGSDFDDEIPF